MTADVGGAVKMTAFTNKVNKEIFVEVTIRQIKLTNDWKNLSIREKRDMLGKDEMKRLATEGKARDGIEIDDTKQIIPVLVEMISMMGSLNRIRGTVVYMRPLKQQASLRAQDLA